MHWQKLAGMGFTIIATGGTATYLEGQGIAVEHVNKVAEGRPHIVDRRRHGPGGAHHRLPAPAPCLRI